MDLQLNIKGDGSGGAAAFSEVATEAQDTAATIEQAFASMAKKTDAAFEQMEKETSASMKKMGDEGAAAWKRAEEAEKANAAQLAKVQAGLLAAGAAAVAFGVDSVKAFAEAQRVQMQLERVAGDLSGAFSQQADALEAQLAIDGELIKQQQTLLLQWGATPGQIEPAVRAINDYAAATGKDALTATMELIKGVETGGEKFKALGVQYEEVGGKTQNLAALTQALANKFGGAAETNAKSLHGSLDAVTIAFGNVKEAFGEVISKVETKMGVLEKSAGFFQNLARRISETNGAMTLAVAGAIKDTISGVEPQAPTIADPAVMGPVAIHLPGFDPNNPTGGKDKPKSGGGQSARVVAHQEESDAHDRIWRHEEESAAHTLGKLEKMRLDLAKSSEEGRLAEEKAAREHQEKMIKDREEALARMTKETNDANAANLQRQSQQWQQAGDSIGAAFVNGLSEQLQKLSQGEEFDVAIFVGDILASAVAIAGTAIGAAYGQPQLGAALGNLAAMGVRAGAGAISAGKKKKMHDGGPVGDEIDIPRFHGGGALAPDEMHIIGQKGEHMLSRRDVANMGGHAGVEAAKRGGPTINNYIQAIDTKSAAESFMGSLGQGMKHAYRTGHGDLPRLLGGRVR